MWLIILAFAATIVTAIWYTQADNDQYLLKYLSLILWGTTIMVLVDHIVPFLMEGGGKFFEVSTEATVLSGFMLVVRPAVWEGALLLKDPKSIIVKRKRAKRAGRPILTPIIFLAAFFRVIFTHFCLKCMLL